MTNFEPFTDPKLMRALLQEHLPNCQQGNFQISACQVLHSQYYTSIRHPLRAWLGICYELSLVTDGEARFDNQLLYARARLGGQSQQEFAQAQLVPLWPPAVLPPLNHLPVLDMTVWGFPNDPQLPHLPQVIDPVLVQAHLPYATLPPGFNDPADLARVEVEVVHYYPEERCTNRYRLWSRHSDQPEPLILFGKTFRDGAVGRVILAHLQIIEQKARLDADFFGVTQALAYDEATQTLWLKFQPGRPLPQVITQAPEQRWLDQVTRGLVALQQCDLPDLPPITLAERLDEIQDKAKKLAQAMPAWQTELTCLLEQLQGSAITLPLAPLTLLHGDFHLRQFLVDGEKLVCCDFDELAQGDPLQDVASFLVDMELTAIAPTQKQRLTQHFYQTYQRYAPWDSGPERLAWQLRYQYFTKAYRFYRQQRPDWQQQAYAMLTRAQAVRVADL